MNKRKESGHFKMASDKPTMMMLTLAVILAGIAAITN